MRSYERSGVTVDQCGECRGIFLDRGEIERLVDMENTHYGAQQQPQPPPQRQPEQPRYQEPRREYYQEPPRQSYGYGHGGYGKHGKHRRKSIFEELFD